MPENTPPEPRPKIKLVCRGKTYIEDKKVGLVFLEVGENDMPGSERTYEAKGIKHVRVGSVYEVEINPAKPTAIYTNTLRWNSLWPNHVEAAAWQIAADAFDTADLAAKQERKETDRNRLPLEVLDGLHDAYWSTNSAGKLAIEVRVLAYLRKRKIDAGYVSVD